MVKTPCDSGTRRPRLPPLSLHHHQLLYPLVRQARASHKTAVFTGSEWDGIEWEVLRGRTGEMGSKKGDGAQERGGGGLREGSDRGLVTWGGLSRVRLSTATKACRRSGAWRESGNSASR